MARVFTDTFETNDLSLWTSQVGTLIAANAENPSHGTYGIELTHNGALTSGYLVKSVTNASRFNIRAYIYIPATNYPGVTDTVNYSYFDILRIEDSGGNRLGALRIRSRGTSTGTQLYAISMDDDAGTSRQTTMSVTITRGEWHYVELEIIKGSPATVNAYLDGTQVGTSLTTYNQNRTAANAIMGAVAAGTTYYQSGEHMYFDDAGVDDSAYIGVYVAGEGVAYSSDFETGDLTEWTGSVGTEYITVSSAASADLVYSAKITLDGVVHTVYLTETIDDGTRINARAYIYVPASLWPGDGLTDRFFDVLRICMSDGTQIASIRLRGNDTNLSFYGITYNPDGGSVTEVNNATSLSAGWHYIELEYIKGSPATVRGVLDGTVIATRTASNINRTIARLHLGVIASGGATFSNTQNLHFDTVDTSYTAVIGGSSLAAPVISVSEATLAFGNRALNTVTQLSFMVTNTGGTELVGTASETDAGYEVLSGTPYDLKHNESIEVIITFEPVAVQSYTGTVTLSGGGGDTVGITGAGVNSGAITTLSRNSIAFGDCAVGQVDTDETFTITNTGYDTLVGTMNISGHTDFTFVGDVSYSLNSGGNKQFSVRFAPSVTGARAATITLTDNGTDGTVSLTGNGAAAEPSQTIDFETGNVAQFQSVVENGGCDLSATTVERAHGTYGSILSVDGVENIAYGRVSLAGIIGSTAHVRAYIYFPTAGKLNATSETFSHIMLIQVKSTTGRTMGQIQFRIRGSSQGFYRLGGINTNEDYIYTAPNINVSSGAWHYIELAVTTGASGIIRGWLDGTLLATVSLNLTGRLFDHVDVGLIDTVEGVLLNGESMYMDDIVVDSSYIGEYVAPTSPVIHADSASLAYGSCYTGSFEDMTVAVTNTGGGTLSGTASTSGMFSVVSGSPYSLTNGQQSIITVRYTPSGTGSHSGTLTLSGGAGLTVALSGTGIEQPSGGESVIDFETNDLSQFASYVINSNAFASQGTVKAHGTYAGKITYSGAGGSDVYGVVDLSTVAGSTVHARAYIYAPSVGFPGDGGDDFVFGYFRVIAVRDAAGNMLGAITFRCNGVHYMLYRMDAWGQEGTNMISSSPNLELSRGAWHYLELRVTIGSAGSVQAWLDGVSLATLTANNSGRLFDNAAFGSYGSAGRVFTADETMYFDDIEVGDAYIGQWTAEVNPTIGVTPASHDYAGVTFGTYEDVTFTVTNTGAGTLTGTASSDDPQFVILSGANYTLNAGQSQSVVVRYTPGVVGAEGATISFTGGGNASRSVTGEGTAGIAVTPSPYDFGSVALGSSSEYTFTLINGTAETINGLVTVSGTGFEVVAGSIYSLDAGDGTVFTVRFTPTVEGSYSGTITLTGGGGVSVSLTGDSGTVSTYTVVDMETNDLTQFDSILGSRLSVVAVHPAHGVYSGKYTIPAATLYESSHGNVALDPGHTRLNMRAYFYFPSGAYPGSGAQTLTYWSALGVYGSGLNQIIAEAYFRSNDTILELYRLRALNDSGVIQSSTPVVSVTRDAWHYIEVEVILGAGNGSARVILDGVEITTLSGLDNNDQVMAEVRCGMQTKSPTMTTAQEESFFFDDLRIKDNGPVGQYVAGEGVAVTTPTIQLTPIYLNFGQVSVGGINDLSFVVKNSGGGTLAGTASVSSPYSIVSGGSYSLTGGQEQTVTVRYSPTSEGGHPGQVTCTGGNGGTVTLSGSAFTGSSSLRLLPEAHDFGNVLLGGYYDQVFTLSNLNQGGTVGDPTPLRSFYVDGGRATNGDGLSWATAWNSLSAIVWSSIIPGDAIYISGGTTSRTYAETLTIPATVNGTAVAPIHILVGQETGYNGTVILDGNGTDSLYNRDYNINVQSNQYIIISGEVQGNIRMRCDRANFVNVMFSAANVQGMKLKYVNCQNGGNRAYFGRTPGSVLYSISPYWGAVMLGTSSARECEISFNIIGWSMMFGIRATVTTGSWTQRNAIHDNEIYECPGDGLYIGGNVDAWDNDIHDIPGSYEVITDPDPAPEPTGNLWYVDNSRGSNGNGQSWATAWNSLSAIVYGTGGVRAGDTVCISGGTTNSSQTYPGGWTIPAGGRGLATQKTKFIVGQDAAHNGTVIIDGNNYALSTGLVISAGRFFEINGNVNGLRHMRFQNFNNHGIRIPGSSDEGSSRDWKLSYITFYECGGRPNYWRSHASTYPGRASLVAIGLSNTVTGHTEIDHCYIDGCTGFMIYGSRYSGAWGSHLIHDNHMENCMNDTIPTGSGIDFYRNTVITAMPGSNYWNWYVGDNWYYQNVGHPDQIQGNGHRNRWYQNRFVSTMGNSYIAMYTFQNQKEGEIFQNNLVIGIDGNRNRRGLDYKYDQPESQGGHAGAVFGNTLLANNTWINIGPAIFQSTSRYTTIAHNMVFANNIWLDVCQSAGSSGSSTGPFRIETPDRMTHDSTCQFINNILQTSGLAPRAQTQFGTVIGFTIGPTNKTVQNQNPFVTYQMTVNAQSSAVRDVNYATLNTALKAGAAAIGAGNRSIVVNFPNQHPAFVDKDFNGNTRGAVWDCGAVAYNSVSSEDPMTLSPHGIRAVGNQTRIFNSNFFDVVADAQIQAEVPRGAASSDAYGHFQIFNNCFYHSAGHDTEQSVAVSVNCPWNQSGVIGATQILISNNTFSNLYWIPIEVNGSEYPSGGPLTDINISNNLFYNCRRVNDASLIVLSGYSTCTRVAIENNIGIRNGVTHAGSIGNTGWPTGVAAGGNSFVVGVQPFVSATPTRALFNPHLLQDSAPMGAGTSVGVLQFERQHPNVLGDHDWRVRTLWDVGAYAYADSESGGNEGVEPEYLPRATGTGGTITGEASVTLPFSILSGRTYTIPAGGSHTITVRYTPTAEGVHESLLSCSGGGGDSANLTGTGITSTAVIGAAPDTLSFGSVQQGSLLELSFTVSNSGAGQLVGQATASPPFSITAGAVYNLSPAQSQTVTVRFAPTILKSYTGIIYLSGGGGAAVAVTGTGIAGATISLSVENIDFGTVSIGASAYQTVTLTNTGEATLSGGASIDPPFAIESGSPYTIAPGESHDVVIRFSPWEPIGYGANATFTGGGGGTVPCTGRGTSDSGDYVEGVSWECVYLDGTKHIEAGALEIPTGQIGIYMWVKNELAGTPQMIWHKTGVASLYIDSLGRLVFEMHDSTDTVHILSSDTDMCDGNWHAVAVGYDGFQVLMYIDGDLEQSTPFEGMLASNTNMIYIGRLDVPDGTGLWYYTGYLDEYLLYERSPYFSEVRDLYEHPEGGGSVGLVAIEHDRTTVINGTLLTLAADVTQLESDFSVVKQDSETIQSMVAGSFGVAETRLTETGYEIVTAVWTELFRGQVAGGDYDRIDLGVDALAVDDYYNGMKIYVGGAYRFVSDYDGESKIATLFGSLPVLPEGEFVMYQSIQTAGLKVSSVAGGVIAFDAAEVLVDGTLSADKINVGDWFETDLTGMHFHMPFDEGFGSFLVDGSGSGKRGSWVGTGAWEVGKVGKAVSFTGNNGIIIEDTDLDSGTLTISFFIKTASTGTVKTILKKAGCFELSIMSSNILHVGLFDGAAYQSLNGTINVCDDVWHCVQVVCSGQSISLIVDGVPDSVATVSVSVPDSTSPWYVGQSELATYRFTGLMDELIVFNAVKSDKTLRGIFLNATLPKTEISGYSVRTGKILSSALTTQETYVSEIDLDFGSITLRNADGTNAFIFTRDSGLAVSGSFSTGDRFRIENGSLITQSRDFASTPATSDQRLTMTAGSMQWSSYSNGAWYSVCNLNISADGKMLFTLGANRIAAFSGSLMTYNNARLYNNTGWLYHSEDSEEDTWQFAGNLGGNCKVYSYIFRTNALDFIVWSSLPNVSGAFSFNYAMVLSTVSAYSGNSGRDMVIYGNGASGYGWYKDY